MANAEKKRKNKNVQIYLIIDFWTQQIKLNNVLECRRFEPPTVSQSSATIAQRKLSKPIKIKGKMKKNEKKNQKSLLTFALTFINVINSNHRVT